MRFTVILACFGMLTTSAIAQDTPSSDPASDPAMVCKRPVTTGSRIPSKKVCRTQKQWDAIARANRDAFGTNQGSARISGRGLFISGEHP